MSSYIAQIMCYACNQTLSAVYEQTKPSQTEVSTYEIDGWTNSDFLVDSQRWGKWVGFCSARLFDGNDILARTWTVGPNATFKAYDSDQRYLPSKHCWVDSTGHLPVIRGDSGVAYCEISEGTSVCGELWYYLSSGKKHNLCAGCSGSTPV